VCRLPRTVGRSVAGSALRTPSLCLLRLGLLPFLSHLRFALFRPLLVRLVLLALCRVILRPGFKGVRAVADLLGRHAHAVARRAERGCTTDICKPPAQFLELRMVADEVEALAE